MHWSRRDSYARGLCVLAVVTVVAMANAQESQGRLVWLPRSDSLPTNMFTLIVHERDSNTPVAHPLVCVLTDGTWMVGMKDGQMRFGGGDMPDTLRLRILAPYHEPASVVILWTAARGRAAMVRLSRRTLALEPSCD